MQTISAAPDVFKNVSKSKQSLQNLSDIFVCNMFST